MGDDGRVLAGLGILGLVGLSVVSREIRRAVFDVPKQTGSLGIARSSRPSPPAEDRYVPEKLTRADFRPRTRPGFYRQKGSGEFVRVDVVYPGPRRQPGAPYGVTDWYVGFITPLTASLKSGPSSTVPAVGGEMHVYELHQADYRRVKPEKVPAAWKAWFDANPP